MDQSNKKTSVIGIRREDKSKWERRVVVTPPHVKQILDKNPDLKIVVQPSKNRIFKDIEYSKAGATISEDLNDCELILGVKEVPKEKLLQNKTYLFFSHVIKAQEHNMSMLDDILSKKIRLIDYEKITDDEGRRLVAFGVFAGNAGGIDFLSGIGKYLINLGYSTPFLNISFSYSYPSLAKAKAVISDLKESISEDGIPEEFCPMIFGLTGKGRCTDGVIEILSLLPHKFVKPDELEGLTKDKLNPEHRTQIYISIFESEHMVKPRDHDRVYSKKDYYDNPHLYEPNFHERYLPHVSVLYHCMYWDPKFPRLISNEQIQSLAEQKKLRLFGICDITCDLEGSIQFLTEYTSIDRPFFIYDPSSGQKSFDTNIPTNNILYHAVDHLPTELAFDASSYFSEKLLPFIENIARSDIKKPFDEQNLCPEIKRAVITWDGKLTPNFEYIARLRKTKEELKLNKGFQTKEMMKKTKSFTTIKISGHLFDTKGINEIFDVLEKSGMKFRILELHIGQSLAETSSAFLQVFSNDDEKFLETIDEIYNIGEKFQFDVTE